MPPPSVKPGTMPTEYFTGKMPGAFDSKYHTEERIAATARAMAAEVQASFKQSKQDIPIFADIDSCRVETISSGKSNGKKVLRLYDAEGRGVGAPSPGSITRVVLRGTVKPFGTMFIDFDKLCQVPDGFARAYPKTHAHLKGRELSGFPWSSKFSGTQSALSKTRWSLACTLGDDLGKMFQAAHDEETLRMGFRVPREAEVEKELKPLLKEIREKKKMVPNPAKEGEMIPVDLTEDELLEKHAREVELKATPAREPFDSATFKGWVFPKTFKIEDAKKYQHAIKNWNEMMLKLEPKSRFDPRKAYSNLLGQNEDIMAEIAAGDLIRDKDAALAWHAGIPVADVTGKMIHPADFETQLRPGAQFLIAATIGFMNKTESKSGEDILSGLQFEPVDGQPIRIIANGPELDDPKEWPWSVEERKPQEVVHSTTSFGDIWGTTEPSSAKPEASKRENGSGESGAPPAKKRKKMLSKATVDSSDEEAP